VGVRRGYRVILVMPANMSEERRKVIAAFGGECVATPAEESLEGALRKTYALAEEIPGSWVPQQFENPSNPDAHYRTTGPEIWEQTGGKVDGFICAAGSGGTVAGVGMALQPKGVKVGLVDPHGAALYSYYTTGELASEGGSITEGIGQGRITANLEGFTPDFTYRASDAEAVQIVFDLLRDEGLVMGGSTGINIAGAMAMAREMGPGQTIVTILCDYGTRYQSKLFNPEFLRSKDLPVPDWLEAQASVPEVFE
jgi:cysteine synthase A